MPHPSSQHKVWIEISSSAVRHNFESIKKLLRPGTELWSVVKSNAYGHGIYDFTRIANELGVSGFCVDSVIEGIKLREQGIQRPILVLGPTLPALFIKSVQHKITLSISSLEALESLIKEIPTPADRPEIHLKVDTGMHRQGLYLPGVKKALALIKKHDIKLRGIFSHFASAKDVNYPTYSDVQMKQFEEAVALCEASGFHHIKKHIAASGGTLINQKYHYNMVRVGIGLYGIFPSRELEIQMTDSLPLIPALSWHSLISEIKPAPKGAFVGYDMAERLTRKSTIAIVPIGYWHGYPWKLSHSGNVLIRGKRAKVLGRVSMDMLIIDVTDIGCSVGDIVTIIGTQGRETITARELAEKAQTTPYEIITRINPLIERVITD